MAFDNMTAAQLQARFVEAGSQLTVLENERQAILAEIAARERAASVKSVLAGLTPEQRDAMRLALEQK